MAKVHHEGKCLNCVIMIVACQKASKNYSCQSSTVTFFPSNQILYRPSLLQIRFREEHKISDVLGKKTKSSTERKEC